MRLLWELFQNARIDQGQAAADNAAVKSSAAERRIKELEAEVDTLNLAVMAMWELFGKANGLFLKDLERKMHEIDLRDGAADGRMTKPELDCYNCGRRVAQGRRTCIYCGVTLVKPLGSGSDMSRSD
ncbi:MAG: hypothetical protein AAFQ62_15665 [Pseudomonadota bacterium]